MLKCSFRQAKFITSAVKAKDYPRLHSQAGNPLPEVAVAGRSNVGKSSLLNHLFRRRDLVKTSSIPGKTQLLNFFTVDDALAFVDLPGYGYAKVPVATRQKWGPMIQEYLDGRPQLKLILFLFDCRRLPNDEDKLFLEWVAARELSLILVLTKVDKLSNNERKNQLRKILSEFNSENLYYTYYSVTKDIGRQSLIGMLLDALNEESTLQGDEPRDEE